MKIKFAPVDAPRKPVYHDESKKVHVKFDSDDESTEPKPQTVIEPKKRQQTAPDSQEGAVGNNAKKRKTQNGTPIPTPGSTNKSNSIPGKRQRDANNTDGSSPTKKHKPATAPNGKKTTLTPEEIEEKKRKKREKNKQRKLAKATINGEKVSVPVLQLQPQTLQKNVAVGDIRNLILYCLAEGTPQPWFKIINKSLIQHLVLIYAPGLDIADFGIPKNRENVPRSVDLQTVDKCFGKSTLPFLTSQFSHMMVYKMSGSKGKLTAAIAELMQCNVSHSQRIHREKMMTSRLEKYKDNMREFYVMTLKQLQAAQYPIPSFLDKNVQLPEGWKETKPAKEPAKQKRLVALDCEMVVTTTGSALARYTLVDEDNKTLVDEYVKPNDPIVDYKTEFSGITEEIMSKAKCSLRRAQKHFRKFVDHNVILVGHGLENDLRALQIAHPYCVDTSLLYDSHRGPPYRPSLRILARNLLKRNIQRNNETIVGHDSAEDAIASLDLFKLKIKKGPNFGRFGKDTELVFDRLHQFKPSKTGVIMESSPTPNGMYRATLGSRYIHCENDATLAEQAGTAMNEYNFVFTQLHTLDVNKSWQTDAAPTVIPHDAQDEADRAARFIAFDAHFKTIYENAPSGTVFCVLGGVGNMPEYHELYSRYVKSRMPKVEGDADEEQVEWTPADMKKLEHLAAKVRLGAFFCNLKQ